MIEYLIATMAVAAPSLGGPSEMWQAIVTDFSNITQPSAMAAFVQVLLIDLVLAGDNAIVVGALAAGLPADQRRKVIIIGVLAGSGVGAFGKALLDNDRAYDWDGDGVPDETDNCPAARNTDQADLDALFNVPSAAITLQTTLGLVPTGDGSVCYRAAAGPAFTDTQTGVLDLLRAEHYAVDWVKDGDMPVCAALDDYWNQHAQHVESEERIQ